MRGRRWYILLALVALGFWVSLLPGRRERVVSAEHVAEAARTATTSAPADVPVVEGVPPAVTTFLRNGQDWRAARVMRDFLSRRSDAPPEAVLLAARAEAGWGGWERVRELLEGRPWLDAAWGGEGWYWLARAREEREEWAGALEAYTRFLAASRQPEARDRRLVAQLRQGLALLRLGRTEEGAARLAAVRAHAPEIGERLDVLAAEALAVRPDTAGVRRLLRGEGDATLARRGRLALVAAYQKAGDARGARALALGYRSAARSAGERAAFAVPAARMALALGDTAAARQELRATLREAPGSAAAELLAGLGALTPRDHRDLALAYERSGRRDRAITHLRAWLAAGAGTEARAVRLRLARALFAAGRYDQVLQASAPLLDAPGEVGAEALLLTGRAQLRRGQSAAGRATLLRLARRHPGTEPGAEGLFLVADLNHDAGERQTARALYRRLASEFRGTDRAGLSLMRLGGMAYQAGDLSAAAAAWEEYRSSYPAGERWLESTYWLARALDRSAKAEQAAALYRAVRAREPLSYYALRSAQRLRQPYWPVPMDSAPPADPDARARVDAWVHGVDLLTDAGLHAEAEAEADHLVRLAGDDAALLYPLAEALNERGHTVHGIRIGYRLRRQAGRLNPRILRIIYPFPYRPMLVAEAREARLDPFLVAALIRQESSFKARVASAVGARGLMQLMPETGRALAAAAGIRSWDLELLYQPEINAHLGTRFLADQMRRYDGALPLVFAAYNAGPSRVQRWRRMPEARDLELFTERIPYRETRDYVKILTRNIAIYRGLYGE